MLYPKLDDLVKIIGNRYLLVNVIAKEAREIADNAADEGIKLEDKPVRLAVQKILDEQKSRYNYKDYHSEEDD